MNGPPVPFNGAVGDSETQARLLSISFCSVGQNSPFLRCKMRAFASYRNCPKSSGFFRI